MALRNRIRYINRELSPLSKTAAYPYTATFLLGTALAPVYQAAAVLRFGSKDSRQEEAESPCSKQEGVDCGAGLMWVKTANIRPLE